MRATHEKMEQGLQTANARAKRNGHDLNIIAHSLGTSISFDVLGEYLVAGNSTRIDNLFMLGPPYQISPGKFGINQNTYPEGGLSNVNNWWIFHDPSDPVTRVPRIIPENGYHGYHDITVHNLSGGLPFIGNHFLENYLNNSLVRKNIIDSIIAAKIQKRRARR